MDILWHKWHENDPWSRVGEKYESSSFHGSQDGKYLFFSEKRELLVKLIEEEVANHGFSIAKVIDEPKGTDYVACIYWGDDSRKYELAERYKNRAGIKYRWFKKNSDTRAGKYSKQFKGAI